MKLAIKYAIYGAISLAGVTALDNFWISLIHGDGNTAGHLDIFTGLLSMFLFVPMQLIILWLSNHHLLSPNINLSTLMMWAILVNSLVGGTIGGIVGIVVTGLKTIFLRHSSESPLNSSNL